MSLFRRFGFTLTGVALVATLFGGCASLSGTDYRGQFLRGDHEAAIETLEAPALKSDRNALLIAMEQGSIYHHSANYTESVKALRTAEKILEAQEIASATDQAKTMLANDWAASYKGEYSERLWVHSYLMMNYLLLSDYQSAAVEARKALQVFEKHPKALDKAWFTRALVALSFESVGKINDAYIEYKKLAQQMPSASHVALPLTEIGKQLGFLSDVEKYRQEIPPEVLEQSIGNHGELVLFVGTGAIPLKTSGDLFVPPDMRISFPRYAYQQNLSPGLSIAINGSHSVFTEVTSNLGNISKKSLDERGKIVFAKAAARTSIKHNLARNLKDQSEVAGELLSLMFLVLEEADTRGWNTLPGNLSLLRIPLKPGSHEVTVNGIGAFGKKISEPETLNIDITAGQRIFRALRF